MILVILGLPGCGKSYITQELVSALDLSSHRVIEVSSIVKKIFDVEKQDKNTNLRNILNKRSFELEEQDPDYLVTPLLGQIAALAGLSDSPITIISGLREPYVYMKVREFAKEETFCPIIVESCAQVRYERLCKRDKKRYSMEEFRQADKNSIDLGLDLMMNDLSLGPPLIIRNNDEGQFTVDFAHVLNYIKNAQFKSSRKEVKVQEPNLKINRWSGIYPDKSKK